jgi:hypothetical protein
MATFELIEDGTYRVEGEITQEDVDRINAFKIRTNLVLQNTKGQSSEIIGKIKTDYVYFSILGGLDYYEKDKFNTANYIERTQSNPKGLTKILQYFEKIEEGINPEWTDTQKCMYAYNALAIDTDYVRELDQDILSNGVTERGLNGILYNQLTCAGMAKTFKEMMDRIGINCYYQNQRGVHAFNVVELEGKLRGVDVTWDCTRSKEEKCSFRNFGRDPQFYEKHGHQIAGDSQEKVFDLTPFTDKEIQENYSVIESAINERKRIVYPFRNFDRDRKRKFLPVDTFKEELQDEEVAITKLRLLNELGTMPQEIEDFVKTTRPRYGFIRDYTTSRIYVGNILEDIKNKSNISGRLTTREGEVVVKINENGKSTERQLTQEQKETISPILYEDLKEYYTQYFQKEALQIDDLVETYSMLQNMPPEMESKTATLRTHIYTKMQLLADGDKFFEQLGIPKEEVELVNGKATKCLNSTREVVDDTKTEHENDLDFMYAIVQNDVMDTIVAGQEYTEQNLARLIAEVRTNCQEIKVSDEEFITMFDEIMSKTMMPEDISRGTVDSGIGIEEINAVTNEIRRTQVKDIQKTHER